MAAYLDVCRFVPTLGGTTDWTYSSAVTGYQAPGSAGVVNGETYRYRAESANLSQWEIGYGTYDTGTGILARTVVLYNSSGTTSKISFSAVPEVAIVAISVDLPSLTKASNGFTGNMGVGGAAGNAILNVIVPNNAGTANAIRFIDDGGASSSTTSNSYGIGVNPSTGAFVLTAGTAGSFQMYTANTQRFSISNAGAFAITSGTLACDGFIKSSNATTGIGYATGAGGTVTQATSRTTGVTLDKVCGAITLFAAAPVVGTWVSFTVTNSAVAATDVPRVAVKSGTNTYVANVSAVAAGSFRISFMSISGTSSDSPVINFDLGKAVTS